MNHVTLKLEETDALFVKDILIFEQEHVTGNTVLPFFADGFPGLVFHKSRDGQWVQPQNKKMPAGYLYGQTLHPIELHINGPYKIILVQLYPFVLNSFFGINTEEMNNECFDLIKLPAWAAIEPDLLASEDTTRQTQIILTFLRNLFASTKEQLDNLIMEALQIILNNNAQITVTELSNKLHVTLRTFERRFVKAVGISAKEFIQISRFHQSFGQLTKKQYSRISDIVYANGYSDQSHFIRVFKAFTGKTPRHFQLL